MFKHELLYKPPAVKSISKLPPHIRKRIRLKLEFFANQDDPLKFAERLTKPTDADYRFRVGVYRILFDIEDNNLVILYVQHRNKAYRK